MRTECLKQLRVSAFVEKSYGGGRKEPAIKSRVGRDGAGRDRDEGLGVKYNRPMLEHPVRVKTE